jgi:hypothetical protein
MTVYTREHRVEALIKTLGACTFCVGSHRLTDQQLDAAILLVTRLAWTCLPGGGLPEGTGMVGGMAFVGEEDPEAFQPVAVMNNVAQSRDVNAILDRRGER